MSYEISYTDNFERELKQLAKKYRSIKTDLGSLLNQLEENPKIGIPLGKECFKIRMTISAKGKGKSGEARVISHIFVEGSTVYLLSIYDKSDKDSISDKELEALLKFIKE